MILISARKNWILNEAFQIHLTRGSLWTDFSSLFIFLKESKMIQSCVDHDNTKQMQINIKVIYFSVGSQPKFFAPENYINALVCMWFIFKV